MEMEHGGNPAEDAMKLALDRMWTQFLPMILERVAILETAAAGVAGNSLSGEEREAARSAAHKLAGALGTFGLADGTELAREAETIYMGDPGTGQGERLALIASEIRKLVESRK
jgi:HPt (histidine-containing phosphotransfer) domain-containing protein